MLKVIGGSLRGRKLKCSPGHTVRPLLGRIKKSLFDILGKKSVQSRFLDLYAGIGSVGIEAISRGAGFTLFVEKNETFVDIIYENLKNLGIEKFARILKKDVSSLVELKGKFDIIFIGPPYKLNLIEKTLNIVERLKVAKKDSIIVSQHHLREKVPREVDKFSLYRTEKYGKSVLSFFKNQ